METGLQLLIRDGAGRLGVLLPRLSAGQYAELMKIVDQARTRAELCVAIGAAAERWAINGNAQKLVLSILGLICPIYSAVAGGQYGPLSGVPGVRPLWTLALNSLCGLGPPWTKHKSIEPSRHALPT
jgi:hypothetical protein